MEKMQARFPPRHEEEKTASGESNVFRAPRPSMRPVALLTGTFSGKAQAMPHEKMRRLSEKKRRKPPRLPARRSDEKGSGIFRRSSAALAPSSRTENEKTPGKRAARPAPFPRAADEQNSHSAPVPAPPKAMKHAGDEERPPRSLPCRSRKKKRAGGEPRAFLSDGVAAVVHAGIRTCIRSEGRRASRRRNLRRCGRGKWRYRNLR